MIAKVIVWDETRAAAIARAVRALSELDVDGIPTTRDLALDVLQSAEFRSGDYSTSTLCRARGRDPVPRDGMTATAGQSRRTALFLLYQWDLTGQPLASLYEGDAGRVRDGARGAAVAERAAALDRRITAASDEWPADRLGTLERNILRIGDLRAGGGDGAARGRDQRGGRAREALRVRGRGRARERDPRPRRAGGSRRREQRSPSACVGQEAGIGNHVSPSAAPFFSRTWGTSRFPTPLHAHGLRRLANELSADDALARAEELLGR